MKFCIRIDALPSTIPEKTSVPVLEQGENERDEFIEAGRAETILGYYRKFQSASFDPALFAVVDGNWKIVVTGRASVSIISNRLAVSDQYLFW